MESKTVEISQPMFYFDKKWITCRKSLTDFGNFNILSISNIQHTIPIFSKEPTIHDDMFPTLNLQKDMYECVDPWNPVECSISHLIDQNGSIDNQLNTPHVSFPPIESYLNEKPNFLCDKVFEDFISQELSVFNDSQQNDSFYENTKVNTLKRKLQLSENLETPIKIVKHNKSDSILNRYPSKKNFDSSQQIPNETLFIFHKHLIKKEQENKKFFKKIKGATYTLKPDTRNYFLPSTSYCENTTLYSEISITIPNIPCYIELILTIKRKNPDTEFKINFIDRKDDKFFVYDRVFTIFFKSKPVAWEDIHIKIKKADLGFVDRKFFNLFKNKDIMMFPIYSIKEILFPRTENRPQKKIKEVKVNTDNIYSVRYIPESNNSWERKSLVYFLYHLGVKLESNNSVKTKGNSGKQPSTNNDMIFAILQGIFYEIKMKIRRASQFRTLINTKRTRKDLASVMKEVFIKCSSILRFDGIRLNTNESLTPQDNIVFSLYLFLYQKIVNTGVEYLDTYDNLVGRGWILTDIYIMEEGGNDIGSNCS